jgi:hypothetical protein
MAGRLMKQTRNLLTALAMLVGTTNSGMAEQLMLPVPAVTIYPGDVIKENMLRERSFPPNFRARSAVVETPLALIGKTARRTLLPGEAVPSNAVDDPRPRWFFTRMVSLSRPLVRRCKMAAWASRSGSAMLIRDASFLVSYRRMVGSG